MKELINNWYFSIDNFKTSKNISTPHTWNIEENLYDFWGIGKYKKKIYIPNNWKDKCIRLFFKAVYHSATVYLNGKKIGEHKNSGYTPFYIQLDNPIFGQDNEIVVEVDNSFSENMLPYKRSFDWSNDGGIIREVYLLVNEKTYIEDIFIDGIPIILNYGKKNVSGKGILSGTININNFGEYKLLINLYKGYDDNKIKILANEYNINSNNLCLDEQILDNIEYWHFDCPTLYTVEVEIFNNKTLIDKKEVTFGFREFKTIGENFCLNGEYVRLCGTEWMPGSNPNFGSAETKDELERWLLLLKESNCVYTRFHWQQDDYIYDWCNKNGMLVQEEIPFWGPDPLSATEVQFNVFKQQIEEMIKFHYNHPSIISWGVGNELKAQDDDNIHYIRRAVSYTRNLDKRRTINYVSNSYFENPLHDGTSYGDIIMINDYIGTWTGDLDQYLEIQKMIDYNSGMPIVPSEFGLCEPFWEGGDPRRIQIFKDKMKCYASFKAIAGTINFSLNDYRTQMGEEGEGKLRQRIHGSIDIYGNKKPSYEIIQKGCAPIEIHYDNGIILSVRNTLPCYEIDGYIAKIFEKDNLVDIIHLPKLIPGENLKIANENFKVKVYRKNGNLVGIYE